MHVRFERTSPFYRDLRSRVRVWFEERRLPQHGGLLGLTYAIGLVGVVATLHAMALSDRFHGTAFFAIQVALGLTTYLIAVGVAHDASHGALTGRAAVDRWFTRLFDLSAVSSFVWTFDHLRSHHAHVNLGRYDNALESNHLFRFHHDALLTPAHRWQHVYAWPLYAFASLHRWFVHDLVRLIRGRSGQVEVPAMPPAEVAWFAFGVVVRNLLFLVLPIALTAVPAWQVVAGFVAMHLVVGPLLVVAVQLTHQSEGSAVHDVPSDGLVRVAYDLAVVRSTTDFSPDSSIVQFLTGGLNLHTVHHLFPNVHHRHLRALNRVLVETTEAHGVALTQRPSVWAAVVAHHRYLIALGRDAAALEPDPGQAEGALAGLAWNSSTTSATVMRRPK